MIVADTGAVLAVIDADDRHHRTFVELFESRPDWLLPWAILPEVDYLLLAHVGPEAELAFVEDVAEGRWLVEWGEAADLERAGHLVDRYRDLRLGLVDAVVMAIGERLRSPIATLDIRDFGAVRLAGDVPLLPRDQS